MNDMDNEYGLNWATLLSLRCLLNRDSEEFSIIVRNIDESGVFGNIVLHQSDVNYIFLTKFDDNPETLYEEDFLTLNGDFSLFRYSSDIYSAYKFKPSNNNCLILFTNRSIDECELLQKDPLNLPYFLQGYTNNNLYNMKLEKLTESINMSKNFKVNNIYVCVIPNNIEIVNAEIAEEIGKTLVDTQLNIEVLVKEFIKFIGAHLNGQHSLTKQDILCVFAEWLFSCYQFKLKCQDTLPFSSAQIYFWKEIIQDKIITIVESDKQVLEFLFEYIRNEVKNICSNSNFNSWTENLSKDEENMFYETNELLNAKIPHKRVRTYLDVYEILWRNRKLPLILEINGIQDYMNILGLLKLLNDPFKVILVNSDLQISPQLNRKDKFAIFESLEDLNAKKVINILKLSANLQGRACVLENLLDKTMFPFVKCRDIIKLILGSFDIGNQFEVSENLMERSYSRVFLELCVLDEIQDETFLIEDCENCFDSLIIKNSNISYLGGVNSVNPGIIVSRERVVLAQLGKLKSAVCVVHHLAVHNKRYLEWKNSFGSIEKIKKFQVKLDDAETDISSNFLKPVTIINGPPGMGKSTLMEIVAKQAPPGKWVLRVDLNGHQNYFTCFRKNSSAIAHLHYFQDAIFGNHDSNSELVKMLFEKLAQSRDVILLLDGFDEISVCYKEQVTDIVKSLHQEGYQMWISTRPVMKQYLEEIFNTFSIDLKPLTFNNLKHVLIQHFSKLVSGSQSLILEFAEKLLKEAQRNLKGDHVEFIGVPLHIKLLADVFQEECKTFISSSGDITVRKSFDLIYLYENYVENRLNVLCDKFHAVEQSDRVMFKEHQSLFALKLLFPFHDHHEVDKEVEYYRNKPDQLQLLQREGLITIDEKLNVNFTHRTFAEYLAARWLSENVQTAKAQNLIKERFNRNYHFLFNIFDRFLAEGCPLHLCIINNKIDEAKTIIKSNPDSFTCTDKCGRSVLHLISLYSVEFPLLFHKYAQFYPSSEATKFLNLKAFEKDAMLEIIEKIPDGKMSDIKNDILGYSPLDYALANNSLTAAHKIDEKFEFPINANINLNLKKSYLGYCALLNYKSLFNLLLHYFASKDFVLKKLGGDVTVNTYFLNMYSNNAYTKSILNYKIDFGTMSILNLLQSRCVYTSYIKDHYSDVHYAIIFDSKDSVEKLLSETTEINVQDQENNTPLHYTALYGYTKLTKLLLEKGAKVDIQNDSEDTPLHIALRENQIEIAKMLLESGASGNIGNKKGETPLHSAIQRNFDNIVSKIVAEGEINDKQNDFGNTPLHLALKKLQRDTARLILSNGADGNISNRMGETPLHYSIQHGYNDIARQILGKGAVNNKQNMDGNTPLQLSLMRGMPDIAELLISNGADVELANLREETSLHCASQKGYNYIVKQILSKLPSINKKNIDYCSTFHLTLMKNAECTAEKPISNDADVTVENRNRETPSHEAIQSGQNGFVEKMLANNESIDRRNRDGNTSLHLALMKDQSHIVDLLVPQGAGINVTTNKQKSDVVGKSVSKCSLLNKQNAEGETPLHLALKKGYHDIVALLIANGAEINIQSRKHETGLHLLIETGYKDLHEILADGVINNQGNGDGNTPLHLALMKKQQETAQLLIFNGASVNTTNNNGETPLHCAIEYGCSDFVTSILLEGVALDKETIHFNTALHMALQKRDLNTATLLLSAGANVNIENCKGDTAFSYALENGYDDIVNKMLSNSTIDNKWVKDGNTLLHLALMKGHLEAAELLIACDADINKVNKNRETPLLLAIQNGYLEIATKIISESNVNVRKRKDGNTPLHWTLVRKDIEIVKLLIAKGANINLGNKKGKTALHCAAKNGYYDMTKELLLAEGVNVNKQSKNGITPLHAASWKGYTEIVKLLLSNGADINLKNKKGKTVIDLAHEMSNCEVISVIGKFKKEQPIENFAKNK